ncbi:MAG: SDR family oxidoreductase [Acidobacteria bacterium]|nr:SDR family oxidoreductase [Acidobacteriota bacterium]
MSTASKIKPPFSLDGELAVITGGGSGLGLAIAQCFIAAGAHVVLVGRNEGKLRAAASQLGSAASYETADVTQLHLLKDLVERISAKHGAVSILVNNAGNHLKKPALETSDPEFANVVNTHVHAAFALSRHVAAGMVERRHGSILFTASMATMMGIPQVVAYSAAKAAHGGLVRALATEWSAYGVRVNAVAPGWIETDMNRGIFAADPERKRKILSRTPMQKFGSAEDIGWAAVYLCSPAAAFVTGAILPVDGGASIGF